MHAKIVGYLISSQETPPLTVEFQVLSFATQSFLLLFGGILGLNYYRSLQNQYVQCWNKINYRSLMSVSGQERLEATKK